MAINNTIRRGQLILPFGIGAIVELPDETLITAGLDVWPYEYRDNPSVKEAIKTSTAIRDERLEKRLSKMLGRPIDKPIKYFLSPTEATQLPQHLPAASCIVRKFKWVPREGNKCPIGCIKIKKGTGLG